MRVRRHGLFLILFGQATPALAADDLAGVVSNLNENISPMGLTAMIVAALIGVLMVVVGLLMIARRSRTPFGGNQSAGSDPAVAPGLTMVIIGALLTVLSVVIGVGTGSTVGSEPTGLEQLEGF